MKIRGFVLAAMLLILYGCAMQKDRSADIQTTSVQKEDSVPVNISEETLKSEAEDTFSTDTLSADISAADTFDETEPSTDMLPAAKTAAAEGNISGTGHNETEDTMRLLIGETEVPVTWEKNASVDALKGLCPLTIQMSMYGGFEQVGPIGRSIVRDDKQTKTDFGDIVLYSGNQIVIFYGSNSWAYTRLGHVNLSQQEMTDLLGDGDVAITME